MWLLRLLRIAAILTPFVPARVAYTLCTLFGVCYFLLNFRARRNILENLRHVNPDSNRVVLFARTLRVCITVVTNYYDLLRLRSIDQDNILERVELHGLEHLDTALASGRGVIIVSAHLGNFSVMARLPAALGHRSALIAEEVKPRELFNYMARLRSAMGIEVIPPGPAAVSQILRLLKSSGLLLVAADRHIAGNGMEVEFFGQRTTLPFGPVYLATRTGATVIPAWTVRIEGHRSKVVLEPPLKMRSTGDRVRDLATNQQRIVHALERMILNDPGQWAVLQRVWPPRSRFERSEGIGNVDRYLEDDAELLDENAGAERRAG